jgi:hypothetical protein
MKSVLADREPMAVWLGASLVAVAVSAAAAAAGYAGRDTRWVVLAIVTPTLLAATSLVCVRSLRSARVALREERARPPADELVANPAGGRVASDLTTLGLPPYGAGMLRYSEAVIELLEHAVGVCLGTGADPDALAAARDDAAALRDLLTEMATEPSQLQRSAKVHTICMLWEAAQEPIEALAAEVDPVFHRLWRARHVATIRMRRGEPPHRTRAPLPYREPALQG